MIKIKNPYQKLITVKEYQIIQAAEPYRSKFGTGDGIPISTGWSKDGKPCEIYCSNCGSLHGHGVLKDKVLENHRIEHCYNEVNSGDHGYYILKVGKIVPDEVLQAGKAWHKVMLRFIDRVRHTGGQYQERKFSAGTALYFAKIENNDLEVEL